MNEFRLQATVKRAVELLKESNYQGKALHNYDTVCFKTVIRYFADNGIESVSEARLDEFLRVQRLKHENGEFSKWRWGIIRRGIEMLKRTALCDSIKIPCLRPWDSVLQKPRQSVELDIPNSEQLADPDDIFGLIWRTKQALIKKGLTSSTIHHYSAEGFALIYRKHLEAGLVRYNKKLTDQSVLEARKRYESKLSQRTSYQNLRKASYLLDEMHRTGKITLGRISVFSQKEPTAEFSELLNRFCNDAEKTGLLSFGSICTAKSAIRKFLFTLENMGIYSFDRIFEAEISRSITSLAKHYPAGPQSALFCIRLFLNYLYEQQLTAKDLRVAIPEVTALRRPCIEGFTDEEISILLKQPDVNTPLGKRNYAIILLAVQTGLRACDVACLKRDNIDWRVKEIRIIQQKTGKALTLPLEIESGNAIADYLLNARPKSNLPYIFLCHTGELRPLHNRSVSGILSKYIRKSGISRAYPRRGFHSLRRSFGTRLLHSDIPFDLIKELLGHTNKDSLKPYLSIDEQGLKSCALSLSSIEKEMNPT